MNVKNQHSRLGTHVPLDSITTSNKKWVKDKKRRFDSLAHLENPSRPTITQSIGRPAKSPFANPATSGPISTIWQPIDEDKVTGLAHTNDPPGNHQCSTVPQFASSNLELDKNIVRSTAETEDSSQKAQPSTATIAETNDGDDVEFVQETPLNGEDDCHDMCQ